MLSDVVFGLALLVFGVGAATAVYVLTAHRAIFSDSKRGVFVRLSSIAAVGIALSSGFILAYLQSGERIALASGNVAASLAALLIWFALRSLSQNSDVVHWREPITLSLLMMAVAFIQFTMTLSTTLRNISPVVVSLVIVVLIGAAAVQAFRPEVRVLRGAKWLGLMLTVSALYFLLRAGVAVFHPDTNEPVRDPLVLGIFAIGMLLVCTLSISAMMRELRGHEENLVLHKADIPGAGELGNGMLVRGYRVQAADMPLMEVAHGYEMVLALQEELRRMLQDVAPAGSQVHPVSDDGYVLVAPAYSGDLSSDITEVCATGCGRMQDLTGLTIEVHSETGRDVGRIVASLKERYPKRRLLNPLRRLEATRRPSVSSHPDALLRLEVQQ